MMSLVLAMIWTRRGQAVTLALLALFAVASAVASPAYLSAVDRAIAAGQVAAAAPAERSLVIAGTQDARVVSGAPDFAGVGAALIELPGFTYVYGSSFPAIGLEKENSNASRLVFRQDVCTHVRIVDGRCLVGEDDILVGARTAARLGVSAGDAVRMTFAAYQDDPVNPHWEPAGIPKQLLIAGVYEIPDPTDVYWGTHGYFDVRPGRGPSEPVLTGATTFTTIDHGLTDLSIDGVAGPAALGVDGLDGLRAGLLALTGKATEIGPNLQVDTAIPALLDRIDSGRSAAHLLVPVLAVPLVLLACFSIFLAVGYGTQGRQPELAIVALRGSRWWTRWWLATGENLFAILAGAVAGCLAGQLLVNLVAAARFPGVGVDAGWSSLRFAPFAALAALGAAVLAQRRQLLSPVATLLRRNPVTANGARALAVEAVVVLLAVVSAVQLILTGGSLTGVGLLAPAFVMLALALLAARALLPLVTRFATRALAAGRLGPALAGYQLSRRPGAQRLFALLVATVAVAGYAACGIDVAARGRVVQSGLGVGAARVLEVEPVHRSRLLHAVRTVDPDGRFAMATARLRNSTGREPLGLAADTTRLAAVATWPGGGPSAAEIARDLRPPAPEPITIDGDDLTIKASGHGVVAAKQLRLNVSVSSLTGLGDAVVGLGNLVEGEWTYRQRVDTCAKGCRINGIQLAVNGNVVGVTGGLTIHSIGGGTAGDSATLDVGRWRMPRHGKIGATPDGPRIDVDASGGLPEGAWVQPGDTPYPLPVAYAGQAPAAEVLTGLDGYPMDVAGRAEVPAVPRLGVNASLVDLEYAGRVAVDAAPALLPEVWLNDRAPADIVEQLTAQGLTVVADTRAQQVRRQLDEQGPALSLWFHLLAGALAVLLGAFALVLAAAVDRERRVEDLSALRVQGLPRPTTSRATSWTYPALVGIAALVGMLTALAGWAVTGWALPLAGVDEVALPLPSWPRVLVLAGATAVVLVLLAAVALATGRDLRRRIKP
ncbi:ABC transporter permease [Actinoplanes solisilvae]|uniref:ABC transporter permease n=1 Tax=Actinoplanes solisilvae TaxID=2486853 RepID=UPI000FDA4274|nr:FtsX-like permease family protein [Actinoplanes solisilvae]